MPYEQVMTVFMSVTLYWNINRLENFFFLNSALETVTKSCFSFQLH
jgi:hypothetical protein